MIRRDVVLLLAAAISFGASDFWNKKKPADWSADEIDQLKTRSPWAKKIQIDGGRPQSRPQSMDTEGSRGSFGGMQGADRNGISEGGGGRGARGGRGGDPDAARAAMATTEVIIRWESAAPLRDATKLQLPPEFENSYAISVTGLPPAVLIMGVGRGEPSARPAERQRAMVQRLLGVTTLTAKGRDPEAAAVVVQSADRASLIFAFPKLPLTLDDKNVVFTMNLGSTAIKAKFEPKEMSWNGQLEL
jgi:hypothetical protein